jgi:inorganic pyrophosphatase/exopolyphosphatase
MDQLNKFLSEVQSAGDIYKRNIDERINICLGNVSCDMDSAVGAILLAYYLTRKNNYYNDYGNYEIFWIPVINCPRGELEARIDINLHIKKYGIDINNLIYINDLDISHYSRHNLLSLALIDHNKLDYSQEEWSKSVQIIIDHHVDLNVHNDIDKTVVFCGSACSLAMNLIFKNGFEDILTSEICKFFSGAILLDTENFKPSLKNTKWSEIDQEAFLNINRIIFGEYYQGLISMKTDRKANIELGLDLILKKDYKNYVWGLNEKKNVAGISVCFNTFHDIMTQFGVETLKKKLNERIEKQNLNIHLVITQTYNGSHAFREIMIFDRDTSRLEKVSELFEKNCPYALEKKKFTGLKGNFSFFFFKDESVSRKKVEPIFQEIFEKHL